MRSVGRSIAIALSLGLCLTPVTAVSWGAVGHRIVGVLAVEGLPSDVPAFLRGPAAAEAMGELAREPDRAKAAGRIHDRNRDPAHNVDIDDEGKILGAIPFTTLPETREDYETALRAGGTNSWDAGYLQYAIIDAYQQVARDFANWRVVAYGERHSKGERKAWYRRDRIRREAILMADLGYLAHFVGDGSQPLHTSSHYNGWGDGPNPEGFTRDKIHGPFEGAFVAGSVTPPMARAAMRPFQDCGCPVERRVIDYILDTNQQVAPLYRLWGQGAFQPGREDGARFVADRLGDGASELRDLIVLAWRESAKMKAGWPAISVADVEAGKVDPYESMMGKD